MSNIHVSTDDDWLFGIQLFQNAAELRVPLHPFV